MASSHFTVPVIASALVIGTLVSAGCEPRKKANTGGTGAATTAVAVATTTTPATTTAPPATTTAPTGTTAPPATTGGWPAMPPGGIDPNVVADVLAKAGAAIGIPAAGGAAVPGDTLQTTINASAAKNAPGFAAVSPVGRATLKNGEHGGMNFDMEAGKCYVVLGAGGPGVTQLGLHMLFPITPPNAVLASDTAHGNAPFLGGDGKPLCPPVKSSVRLDVVPMAGAGQVAVQVWSK